MFGLTVLYLFLFFYVRFHIKKFPNYTYSSDRRVSAYETQNWQANLESGIANPPTSSQAIFTTQTVLITSEDRPRAPNLPRRGRAEAHRRMNHIALTLLCYPTIYICLALPIAITRISQFAGNQVGFAAIYVSVCMYSCSGWVNVLVYTATRKGIISWDRLFKRKPKMPPVGRPMETRTPTRHLPAESFGSLGSFGSKEPSLSSSNNPQPEITQIELE